jgi:hypothetical protein
MIAYYFPPEGNAGAYRPLRFARHLLKYEWVPTVISAIPNQYERYDTALLRSIPHEVEVIRTKSSDLWQTFQAWRSKRTSVEPVAARENFSSDRILNKCSAWSHLKIRTWLREAVRTWEAWWYHPDMASPWMKTALKATIEVCLRKQPSAIWATAGPITAFHIARLASKKTNVPYVLDFRDAWTITYNEFEARRPAWAFRRDRQNMFELLHEAQAVIFRYHTEAECFWQAYSGALDAGKIYIIPNGFELPIEEIAPAKGDKCTILYAGTLPDYRYDTLLKSLVVLKATDPSRAKNLRVLFIGEGIGAIANQAASLNLTDIIETAGRKSHAEVRLLERSAHALLILGRPATMRGYELFAGAKLFGYLKAGRPIVGILPEDETKKILHRLGVRTVADVDSVSEIMGIIRLVIDAWSSGTLSSIAPDRKACEAYSSEHQTATLVRALEGTPPHEPFIPGAQIIPPSLRDSVTNTK